MTPPSIVAALNREELVTVLTRLLTDHSDLYPEVTAHAEASVKVPQASEVSDRIVAAVTCLDFHALNRRAGSMGGYYVEATEASCDLLNEAVEPFLSELKRLWSTGLVPLAALYYEGVLQGLAQLRSSQGDVLDMAPDFPGEAELEVTEWWESANARSTKTGARVSFL